MEAFFLRPILANASAIQIRKRPATMLFTTQVPGVSLHRCQATYAAVADVPIIGWIDDAGLTLAAGINLIQQFVGNQNTSLVKLLKYAKWTFVSMVAIAVLLLGGLIALIVNLIAK